MQFISSYSDEDGDDDDDGRQDNSVKTDGAQDMDIQTAGEGVSDGGSAGYQNQSQDDVVLCEMCKKTRPIYKCPRCSVITCSLECCKAHKTRYY
jgi:hypothetical protein